MQASEQDIRTFIRDNLLFGEWPAMLTNDASFLESGIIDSTGVLDLVNFIESKYGIAIHDDELVPQNLDSVNGILAFVQRKLEQGNAHAG